MKSGLSIALGSGGGVHAPRFLTPPVLAVYGGGPAIPGAILELMLWGSFFGEATNITAQVHRNGIPVTGPFSELGTVYTFQAEDVGALFTVVVTIGNAGGTDQGETNGIECLPSPPSNAESPTVSSSLGTSEVVQGQEAFIALNGIWSGSPASFSYQWLIQGTPVPGATGSTFNTSGANEGESVICAVTASNAGGESAPAWSNSITVIIL